MCEYIQAVSQEHYQAAAFLFKEYAEWLNINLSFQHFDEELQQLQNMYTLPHGGIILCRDKHIFIGCVGIRKITEEIAELKRMYVLPAYQGKGIGNEILNQALLLAKKCGYNTVRLDTLKTMLPAMNLYSKNGFKEINAYYHNPIDTVVYFEKYLPD